MPAIGNKKARQHGYRAVYFIAVTFSSLSRGT